VAEAICKGVCAYYKVAYKAPATKLYRVQVGAFRVYANAEKQLAELKKAGYTDAYIVQAR
jgi:cell division septation protein DedD